MELIICAHSHIQSQYTRLGKRIVNPGSVGIILGNKGKTQFMMLCGNTGCWETEYITLPYDVEEVIREMDEEKLSQQAPAWYRITKAMLRGGNISQANLLFRASELYRQTTGMCDWRNIPEQYWQMALEEYGIP